MRQIILASGSQQRKMLMGALGIKFNVVPSEIDEKAIKAKNHKVRARLIALAKAKAVSKKHPQAIIISGDTYVFCNGKSYEKPENLDEAKQMLEEQSGREAVCYSGCAYLDPQMQIEFSNTAQTTFVYREFSEKEIQKYVTNNPVLTWSAGFCPAYPEGINMVESINGSYSSFSHGLPMEFLVPLLEKSGVFNEED